MKFCAKKKPSKKVGDGLALGSEIGILYISLKHTFQKLHVHEKHLAETALPRIYTCQKLHFSENLFSKSCIFPKAHLAEIT